MCSRKTDAEIVSSEEQFLQLLFKIGLLGCICSFIMIVIINFVSFFIRYISFSGVPFDWSLYWNTLQITNSASFISAVLMAIGFFALLRSNLSRLALPYVFLSLIGYATSWTFLLSLGFEYIDVRLANTAESITLTVILAWILWTINSTVSDRGLLRDIVVLTLADLVYSLVYSYLLESLFAYTNLVVFIYLRFPTIFIGLTRIVLIARLFWQDPVVVIDDEIRQGASSDCL